MLRIPSGHSCLAVRSALIEGPRCSLWAFDCVTSLSLAVVPDFSRLTGQIHVECARLPSREPLYEFAQAALQRKLCGTVSTAFLEGRTLSFTAHGEDHSTDAQGVRRQMGHPRRTVGVMDSARISRIRSLEPLPDETCGSGD